MAQNRLKIPANDWLRVLKLRSAWTYIEVAESALVPQVLDMAAHDVYAEPRSTRPRRFNRRAGTMTSSAALAARRSPIGGWCLPDRSAFICGLESPTTDRPTAPYCLDGRLEAVSLLESVPCDRARACGTDAKKLGTGFSGQPVVQTASAN